jgi:hypothetical protein
MKAFIPSTHRSIAMISLTAAADDRIADLRRTRDTVRLERHASAVDGRPSWPTRLRLRLGRRLVLLGTFLLEGSGGRRVSVAGRRG